jgi:hypothetical protein
LASPSPRGFYRTIWEVFPQLPALALVPGRSPNQSGISAKTWLSESLRNETGCFENYKKLCSKRSFLFAMCAATDTYDIALSAENTDVCESMYDGDPAAANFNEHLDFTRCFAFQNFTVEKDPYEYEFSNIDVDARTRKNKHAVRLLYLIRFFG